MNEGIAEFHGTDKATHDAFQSWRRAHRDGFHMAEQDTEGDFIVHWTQDKREHGARGCIHQGVSAIKYREDKGGCYTTARKVCSDDFTKLLDWAAKQGYTTRACKHCDTQRFPFPRSARTSKP
jgi:hypothetical protein